MEKIWRNPVRGVLTAVSYDAAVMVSACLLASVCAWEMLAELGEGSNRIGTLKLCSVLLISSLTVGLETAC